jgi:hypothetical protein
MDSTACTESHLGTFYEEYSRHARIAGYVLLAGLFLEIVNGIIWFHGIEGLASLISVALMLGGVSGEIFFQSKAKLVAKGKAATPVVQCLRVDIEFLTCLREVSPLTLRKVGEELLPSVGEGLPQSLTVRISAVHVLGDGIRPIARVLANTSDRPCFVPPPVPTASAIDRPNFHRNMRKGKVRVS